MGIGRGAGTTHLSVMIANYLSGGHRRKVLIAALGSDTGFDSGRIQKNAGFDYVYCKTEKDMVRVMTGDYDDIIIDTSERSMIGRREFQRSHKKIIVGSMSRWKIHELHNYLEKYEEEYDNRDFHFLSLTYDRKEATAIRKRYGVNICMVPYEKNPYHIEGKHMQWIKELIV